MSEEREQYLAYYCADKKCEDRNGNECDNCMYEKGRADVIEEVWNTLIKYQRAIENANYPFNFIQIAFDEVRETIRKVTR